MMMMLVMVITMQLRDPVLGGQELTPKSADSQTKRTVPFSLAVQLGRLSCPPQKAARGSALFVGGHEKNDAHFPGSELVPPSKNLYEYCHWGENGAQKTAPVSRVPLGFKVSESIP